MKNIFISVGDPTGISYEIFDAAYNDLKKYSKKNKIIIVNTQKTIKSKYETLNNKIEFDSLDKIFENNTLKPNLYFLDLDILNQKEEKKLILGKPSALSGRCAYQSLSVAMQLQKKFGGNLITLPLSKEWVIADGNSDFTGHTEELAKFYKKKTFMLMYGDKLKVLPLTTHIPLKNVSEALTKIHLKELIKTIKDSHLLKNPRIAICGLNPHAGENGKIGNEEQKIIIPVIQKMRNAKLNVSGPIPADSLFIPEIAAKFDLILACYHDQGLIPFKAFEGKNGINVTLGLDFIRVSPDHGTAFDIAGKNIADAGSFKKCLKVLARDDIY